MIRTDSLETPRQRIRRYNKQINYWKCHGDTRVCSQPICVFCQHLRIWKGYEGETDADCLANVSKWLDGDEIMACRKFKAQKHWRFAIESLLNEALMDIVKDLTGRLTEAKSKDIASYCTKQRLSV